MHERRTPLVETETPNGEQKMTLPELNIAIETAHEIITDRTDGPLTMFVLLSRACDLVASGSDPEAVANALDAALRECDFIRDRAAIRSLDEPARHGG